MSCMITDRSGLDDEAMRMAARLDLALDIAARKSARRRPEDTSRMRRTMWDLLRWTYGTQQVRGRLWSVSRWSDVLFSLEMPDGPACPYHIDAVVVHAAVSMLPQHQRDAVWQAAEALRLPPMPDPGARPRFEPVMRKGRGNVGPVIERYWHACEAPKLKAHEVRALEGETDRERRIVTRYENRRGQGGSVVEWTYRVDPRPPSAKMARRQNVMRDAGTGRLRDQRVMPAEVLVPYCPVRAVATPEMIVARHDAYAALVAGVAAVFWQLAGRALFGATLVGAGVDEAPPRPGRDLFLTTTRVEREVIDAAWPMAVEAR